jgi:hypothetical protein
MRDDVSVGHRALGHVSKLAIKRHLMRRVAVRFHPRPAWAAAAIWVIGIGLSFCLNPATAADLAQPAICSAANAGQPEAVSTTPEFLVFVVT